MKDQDFIVERLFQEYRDKVFGFFVDFLNNRDLAQDLTQDIFVKLLQKDQLDHITDMDGYVYQMCRNLAFDHLKKAAHNTEYRKFILEAGNPQSDQSTNPIERKTTADHYEYVLRQSLNKLPEQQRLIFTLSQKEGLSHKKIAKNLGISSHTVRNHLYQAMKTLRAEVSHPDMELMILILVWWGL